MSGVFRFNSIRVRLIVLLLAVALPLAGMAGALAWQNARLISARPLHLAEATLAVALARHEAIIAGVRSTLQAVASLPAVADSDVACATAIAMVLSLHPSRYTDVAVFGADGRVRCATGAGSGAGSGLAAAGWGDLVRAGGRFQVGPPQRSSAGGAAVLPAVAPLLSEGRLIGGVVAGVTLDLVPDSAGAISAPVWLLDDRGVALVTGGAAAALPEGRDLAALLDMPSGVWRGRTIDGQPAAYAVREISPGLHLLGAAIGTGGHVGDWLAGRLALLAGLMAVALVVILLGADRIVVQPLKRFNRAVARWRVGGPVDLGPLSQLPAELRELSLTFMQATAALTEHEGQLRASIAQRDLLMQEIHHRVKNNLQIVASLLNLQSARIRQPEARAEFQSARDRVRALATVHRHLYAHGELHTINMRSFLNELCLQLVDGLGPGAGQRITLDIDAPELQMSSDQAVPIALIVTETVSNAVKYAFPAGRTGTIRVCLSVAGEEARLLIADDGIGLPADPEPSGRDGIGLQLIRGLARQLAAALTVSEEGGTRYEFVMKVRQARILDPPVAAGT